MQPRFRLSRLTARKVGPIMCVGSLVVVIVNLLQMGIRMVTIDAITALLLVSVVYLNAYLAFKWGRVRGEEKMESKVTAFAMAAQ